MNIYKFISHILLVFALSSFCFAQPVTPGVTVETKKLLSWLSISDGKIAIGAQHSANISGWVDQQKISGFSPLIYGIEYRDSAGLENDPTYWEWSRNLAISVFLSGGVVTIVDHMPNLATGGNWTDKHPDMPGELLPGGKYHEAYKSYLDRFALFAQNVSVKGLQVPLIYRPFHEMNGGWFWWGKSPKFVELWKFTYTYLTQVKGVKNLLWAWSPNIEVWDVDKFAKYWPGKGYVDIVGLDGYGNSSTGSFAEPGFRSSYSAAVFMAQVAGKPFVWSEVGFEQAACNRVDFWTNDFLKSADIYYQKARYILIWNGKYGPRQGCPSSAGFKEMMNNTARVTTLGRVDPVVIYGTGYEAVSQ